MANKKSKILMVATLASTLYVFYSGLIRRLAAMGYEVAVAASDDYYIDKLEKEYNCKVYPLKISRSISPFKDLNCIMKLVQLIRNENYDIVHAHTPKAGIIGMTAAFLATVPNRVYTLHGMPLDTVTGLKRELFRQGERFTFKLATCRLIVSRSLADRAVELGICRKNSYQILANGSACGVDRTRFCAAVKNPERIAQARKGLNLKPDAFVIGFVGRVTPDKGIDCLLDVYESMQKKNSFVNLLIVGDFDKLTRKEYQQLESRLLSNPGIKYQSFTEDIISFYSAMDILVLPSKREGFNYALLEAAACGLPAVTTRATGCIDMVVDGQTGFVIDIDDRLGLENAVNRLIASPELRQMFGKNAQKRAAELFDAETLIDAHISLYNSFLK